MDWSTFKHWWQSVVRPQVRRASRKRHKQWPQLHPGTFEPLEPRKLLSSALLDAPTPQPQDANINFNSQPVSSYGGNFQDVTGNASVQNGGSKLSLQGNLWKKLSQNYTITENTVLEFDFSSSNQAEVSGIGFDTDDNLSDNTFFQVHGSQEWGIQNFNNYASGTKHYTINVGDFFTGSFNYLTLGNDHDVNNPNGQGSFSNIVIYEDTGSSSDTPPSTSLDTFNFNTAGVTVYDNSQNVAGNHQVQDGGDTLFQQGNNFRKIALDYDITENTILEFDFRSTSEGEVHGIGFDDNNFLSGEGFIRVFGTQGFGHDAHDNYNGSGDWKHYKVQVADFYTGDVNYLFFANDDDTNNPDANSWYANVSIYEEGGDTGGGGGDTGGGDTGGDSGGGDTGGNPDAPNDVSTIDLDTKSILKYGGNAQDVTAIGNVIDNGDTLNMQGNSWKAIAFNYTVTADTILEFDFKADPHGEVHGIGFDTDTGISSENFFQIGGSQGWGIEDYRSSTNNTGWQHFKISVGDFFTGSFNYLTFGSDHDVNNPNANVYYSNIAVYEDGDGGGGGDTGGGDTGGNSGGSDVAPPSPATNEGLITFSNNVQVYDQSQDVAGDHEVQNSGQTLHQHGNNLRKVAVNYNITENTVLEFDFRSDSEGEVHGIGFDNDDSLTDDFFFRVFGTQGFGEGDFDNYSGNGDWQHYKINVGEFFTGNKTYLWFANDHDVNNPDATSWYANVALYEDGDGGGGDTGGGDTGGGSDVAPPDVLDGINPFNFNSKTPQVYDPTQNVAGDHEVLDSGRTLHQDGNNWRKISLPYNITENTILEFDFRSTSEGEVHGIGFDTDNSLSGEMLFRVFGTQGFGIGDHDDYSGNGQWKHYKINVGDFFTGNVTHLIFANDDDTNNPDANSWYANVSVYEEGADTEPAPGQAPAAPDPLDDEDPIIFNIGQIDSYGGPSQDVVGAASTTDGGRTLHIVGNSWKKMDFNYTITENTILEFDFFSNLEGEVHGIGFDDNPGLTSETFFQVDGSQDWGITTFKNYDGSEGSWKHYKINVGDFFTGSVNQLTFGNDHDVALPYGEGYFANVTIYEEGGIAPPPPVEVGDPAPNPVHTPIVNFDNENVQAYDGAFQDITGIYDTQDDGRTLHLTGNTWKKITEGYNVTAQTVLSFHFRTDSLGEVHGIGFDTDNSLSPESFIQVAGTQDFGFTDYKNYSGDDWVHYEVNIGALFTGNFTHLIFASDDDVANPDAEAWYANIAIFEDTSIDVGGGGGGGDTGGGGGDTGGSTETPPDAPSGLDTLNLNNYDIEQYTDQTMSGDHTVSHGGAMIHMDGNSWRKIEMPYNVGSRTVIEFDFKSTNEGEIHAIGFDTDDSLSSDRMFQLFGTQDWGIQDYNTYDLGDGWVHYKIEIGNYYQGVMNHLVISNDDDAGNQDGEAYFANISVYDEPLPPHTPSYNNVSGWGLVDAGRAVSRALGNTTDPLPEAGYYGNSNHWGLNAINAPDAWQAGYTGQGVVVAVIDTGVNYNHSDLNDNIWVNTGEIAGDGIDNDGNGFIDDVRGWDFVGDDNNPMDSTGHGTLVAGVIAAEDNGTGATGVAPDAKIMPIKVIDGVGGGDFYSVLDGIRYAADNGADVINLSIAFETGHPDLQAALTYAYARGVVVVSAAGNTGASDPMWPAEYSTNWGIGVGASTKGNGIASFSNRAGDGTKDFVLAPGVSVYTTNSGGGYSAVSATSFSTPYVAGVAALVTSANPLLPTGTIELYISQSANNGILTL